ncbi:MAG: dihydrodipicolinate synthase family protein [Reyranellaceae bacterium]
MDRNSVDWTGSMTAIVTPFHADGRIDETAFRRLVEWMIGPARVTGIVVGGCTGEFWAMTIEERKHLFKLCIEAVAGRVPVIAGTGAITLSDTVDMTRHAAKVGCAGAMVMPPYFVKLGADEIVAHFQAVSDAVPLPLMAYNIPANNVNALTPAIADRLADVPNVVALKESSFDYDTFSESLKRVRDRLLVFGPTFKFGAGGMALGAVGSIGTMHHICGSAPTELDEAAIRLDFARTGELQDRAARVWEVVRMNGGNLYAVLKAAMNVIGLPGGFPRSPLQPVTGKHLADLEQGLRRLGLDRIARDAA